MAGNFMSGASSKEFVAADDRPLFDRQPRESDQAWEAFCTYRDLGLSRSTAKAAQGVGKSLGHIQKWSSTWGWRARSSAWDREIDKRKRSEDLKAVGDMRKRHLDLSMAMQRLATLELMKLLKTADTEGEAGQLTSADVTRLVEAATKIERVNRDMPSEIIEERTGMTEAERDARIAQLMSVLDDE